MNFGIKDIMSKLHTINYKLTLSFHFDYYRFYLVVVDNTVHLLQNDEHTSIYFQSKHETSGLSHIHPLIIILLLLARSLRREQHQYWCVSGVFSYGN